MSAKGLRYFSLIINFRLIKFVEYWHRRSSIKGPTSRLFGLVNPDLPGRWLLTGRLEGGWFSVWCPLTAVLDCVLLTYSMRVFCPSLDVMGEWCIYFLLIRCMSVRILNCWCMTVAVLTPVTLLWPPCVADAHIIFISCGFFFYLLLFFPCLISAVAEWMSTILLRMVWPYYEVRMQVWNVLRAARRKLLL